jgi:hypothetical protein
MNTPIDIVLRTGDTVYESIPAYMQAVYAPRNIQAATFLRTTADAELSLLAATITRKILGRDAEHICVHGYPIPMQRGNFHSEVLYALEVMRHRAQLMCDIARIYEVFNATGVQRFTLRPDAAGLSQDLRSSFHATKENGIYVHPLLELRFSGLDVTLVFRDHKDP